MDSIDKLKARLKQYGQDHLLRFWDELDESERNSLLDEIYAIDFEAVTNLYERATDGRPVQEEKLGRDLKPVPAEAHGSVSRMNADDLKKFEGLGLKEISESRVGVLLLAGGQGTRLGVSYPKGMYDVGLPSRKPLFQIQAERILKLQSLAKAMFSKSCSITWYIMTSDATMENTRNFFEKRNYFGLDKNNIVMFEQGMLPCFDAEGKILLEKKNKIAKAPDGNGGLYKALKEWKVLDDMDARGVKWLHAYCVDNILVRVADPVFIGYCLSKGADCAAKVVEKVSPDEQLGVVCEVNGKLQVVEYSEMLPETAEKRGSDNRLIFNAGSICNHFFSSEFLRKVAEKHENELKLHVAHKKIPYVDESGNEIKPTAPNGVKIEKFVFDVFPYANNFVTWEVKREEEFSALKNSESSSNNNPKTVREDIYRLHKIFIEKAGGKVTGDGDCEISPLLSYAGEGLDSLCKGKTFECPVLFSADQEQKSHQNGEEDLHDFSPHREILSRSSYSLTSMSI